MPVGFCLSCAAVELFIVATFLENLRGHEGELDAEVPMAVVIERDLAGPMVFDQWTLHGDGRLTGEGSDIQLPPKEGQVLRLLLVSAGALVTKDRLLEKAWPHNEATEESLTRCICSLRKYLKAGRGLIKTVYGKGYRMTCSVRRVSDACSVCGRGQA